MFLFSVLIWFLPHCFKLGVMTMFVADIALAAGIAFPRKITEFLLEQGVSPDLFPPQDQASWYGLGAGIVVFSLCFLAYYFLHLRKIKQRLAQNKVNYAKNSPQAKFQSPQSTSKDQNKASFKASKDHATLPLGHEEGASLNSGINVVVEDEEEPVPAKKFLKQRTRSKRARARSLGFNDESNLSALEGNPLYAGVKDDSSQDVNFTANGAKSESSAALKRNPLDGVAADSKLVHGSAVLTDQALTKIELHESQAKIEHDILTQPQKPELTNQPQTSEESVSAAVKSVDQGPFDTSHGDSIEVEMLAGSKVGDVLSAIDDGKLPLSTSKPKVDLAKDSSFSFADMLDSAKKYQNHTSGDDTGILVDVTDDIVHNQKLTLNDLSLNEQMGEVPSPEVVQSNTSIDSPYEQANQQPELNSEVLEVADYESDAVEPLAAQRNTHLTVDEALSQLDAAQAEANAAYLSDANLVSEAESSSQAEEQSLVDELSVAKLETEAQVEPHLKVSSAPVVTLDPDFDNPTASHAEEFDVDVAPSVEIITEDSDLAWDEGANADESRSLAQAVQGVDKDAEPAYDQEHDVAYAKVQEEFAQRLSKSMPQLLESTEIVEPETLNLPQSVLDAPRKAKEQSLAQESQLAEVTDPKVQNDYQSHAAKALQNAHQADYARDGLSFGFTSTQPRIQSFEVNAHPLSYVARYTAELNESDLSKLLDQNEHSPLGSTIADELNEQYLEPDALSSKPALDSAKPKSLSGSAQTTVPVSADAVQESSQVELEQESQVESNPASSAAPTAKIEDSSSQASAAVASAQAAQINQVAPVSLVDPAESKTKLGASLEAVDAVPDVSSASVDPVKPLESVQTEISENQPEQGATPVIQVAKLPEHEPEALSSVKVFEETTLAEPKSILSALTEVDAQSADSQVVADGEPQAAVDTKSQEVADTEHQVVVAAEPPVAANAKMDDSSTLEPLTDLASDIIPTIPADPLPEHVLKGSFANNLANDITPSIPVSSLIPGYEALVNAAPAPQAVEPETKSESQTNGAENAQVSSVAVTTTEVPYAVAPAASLEDTVAPILAQSLASKPTATKQAQEHIAAPKNVTTTTTELVTSVDSTLEVQTASSALIPEQSMQPNVQAYENVEIAPASASELEFMPVAQTASDPAELSARTLDAASIAVEPTLAPAPVSEPEPHIAATLVDSQAVAPTHVTQEEKQPQALQPVSADQIEPVPVAAPESEPVVQAQSESVTTTTASATTNAATISAPAQDVAAQSLAAPVVSEVMQPAPTEVEPKPAATSVEKPVHLKMSPVASAQDTASSAPDTTTTAPKPNKPEQQLSAAAPSAASQSSEVIATPIIPGGKPKTIDENRTHLAPKRAGLRRVGRGAAQQAKDNAALTAAANGGPEEKSRLASRQTQADHAAGPEKKAGRPSLKSHFAQVLGKNPTGGLAARNVSALLNASRPQFTAGAAMPQTLGDASENTLETELSRPVVPEKQHSLKRLSRLSEAEQAQRSSSRLGSKIEDAPARGIVQPKSGAPAANGSDLPRGSASQSGTLQAQNQAKTFQADDASASQGLGQVSPVQRPARPQGAAVAVQALVTPKRSLAAPLMSSRSQVAAKKADPSVKAETEAAPVAPESQNSPAASARLARHSSLAQMAKPKTRPAAKAAASVESAQAEPKPASAKRASVNVEAKPKNQSKPALAPQPKTPNTALSNRNRAHLAKSKPEANKGAKTEAKIEDRSAGQGKQQANLGVTSLEHP